MTTQTPRLFINDLRLEDFTDLLQISSDPEVARTNDYLPGDADNLRAWLEQTLASEAVRPRTAHHSAIRLRTTGELIGWIGLQSSAG